ncbi:MAG TPA: PDZ domain-containing protein [Pyrinomonadaceae bacterium]|nr:PDZ domain-containing protein [Pyrinomonadaceae bacterium]
MNTRSWMRIFGLLLMVVIGCVAPIRAQVATTPAPTTKKPAAAPRTDMVNVDQLAAPQVVTILHRLNGLKLFRLMARENKKFVAIAQLDEAFKIMGDVHTNVIAGLAMNDGQTIVARLPEVEAELGSPRIPYTLESQSGLLPVPPKNFATTTPADGEAADPFDEPNVTVIARDGRRFLARYVGLDGVTGLSVLKLVDKSALPVIKARIETISVGQHLRLFGPEPIVPRVLSGNVSVRIGEIEGTITNLTSTPSGGVSKMKIRSDRMTAANIGGIAVNDAGQTIGIVDSIEQGEASLLSTAQISNAASRVLSRQSSVPRPWLGVSGEPIESLDADDLINSGWQKPQAMALTQDRCGILLTAVAPDSPAAVGSLRSGDVILRVNGEDIRTADDFSWLLAETGPGNSASFTVMRPGKEATETLNLKLSGGFSPRLFSMTKGTGLLKQGLLMAKGIETVALMPAVAARFGATGGLLVIYVQPETEGFKAGLRPGDVIETINGQQISGDTMDFADGRKTEFKFDVVRRKQKMTFTLVNAPE